MKFELWLMNNIFQGSLFDGELVWEYESGHHTPPRQVFLVFDLVALRNVSFVSENYLRRYALCSTVFRLWRT